MILADGQIGQTLLFFCFDDERALAWGSEVKGFHSVEPTQPQRCGTPTGWSADWD
jgi:hypothetical protein